MAGAERGMLYVHTKTIPGNVDVYKQVTLVGDGAGGVGICPRL
ncbi:MAG: hypothetical protein C5S48_08565 [Candidatus Methanogaster sp.]|nr:MAG: hypothetical protein C5S48_08565 [ANME-2 cluster archaeon]